MKNVKAALLLGLVFATAAHADDDQTLLDAFHKYGITQCDKFILENSRLVGNWTYFIGKHAGGIEGNATEVSLIRIWGSEGDTVKSDDSYIQTAHRCYLTSRSTLSFPGTCESNINKDHWYVSNKMPGRDYTTFKNKGDIEMQAKEIAVGNFKACIQETLIRKQGPQG